MTREEFDEITFRINELWPRFEENTNDVQLAEWFAALCQFPEMVVREAIGTLYREGCKYALPRLPEVAAVCRKQREAVKAANPEPTLDNRGSSWAEIYRKFHAPKWDDLNDHQVLVLAAKIDYENALHVYGPHANMTAARWGKWKNLYKGGDGVMYHNDEIQSSYDEWRDRKTALEQQRALETTAAERESTDRDEALSNLPAEEFDSLRREALDTSEVLSGLKGAEDDWPVNAVRVAMHQIMRRFNDRRRTY